VGNWTTVSDWGGMGWSAPADTGGAGIKDYAYYWGADANGTGTAYTTAASYDPPNITGTSNAIYYLRVAARDNALNLGPWKTLYTYRYDAVAPAAPATDPADVWSKTDNPGALSWAAVVDNAGGSGTAGYNYYWGMDETGAPSIWTTGTSYSPGAVNREGSYYLRVQTRDVAGNTSAVKTVRKWSFDKTAPGISTTNTVENWTSENNRAVFGWTPAPDGEGSGIAGYNTRWLYGSTLKASGYSNTNSYDPPECGSGDGLYYLQAQAVDNVGLTGPWTTVLTYQYDGSRPGQTSSAATQNWTNDNDVPETAWLEVADGNGSGVAGYHVYWGLSPTGTDLAYQTDRTYDPVSPNVDGVYYLRVQAVDGVGLTGNWTTVLTYKYDRSKPGISATSIIEGWTSVNSRSVLTWDEAPDDGSGIAGYYMYRGTDPDGESADFLTKRQYDSPPLSGDDRYFFRVQALDNAGNTGNWTTVYSYLYDTTAPDISPTDVTEGWTSINNRSLFSWTDAPDNLSGIAGYYCYWGREPRGISADYVTTAAYDPPLVTSNGVYYLNVQAVDMSGNLGGWTTVLTYRYDGVTPDGSAVISGGKTETRSKVIALFSVASDIGSSVTSMNIGETDALNVWLPFATQYNYELKDTTTGNKTLTIWFADAAGNISAPSVVTINYIGFAGADRAIIVNDDSGYINTINTTLIIDVDTGASEMRLSDDATLSPWLSPASVLPWTFSAGDGEKTVYVEYRDAADYVWGTGVYSGTVTLDTIPPSQGRITINNGDGSVDSTLVELAIAASGEPYTLKLWNVLDAEPADNQYIDYTNALDWTLKFLDGLQTVNIRFRDFAGNASEIYSDSIYVDLASGGYSFVFNESDGDNDIASSDFKIRWTDSYRPDPLAEIELSYHEVGGASGVISSNILVTDLVNGLLWDCRGLATGVYYLKAQVSGNRGFFEVTSNYPILVFHDNSLPADPPTVLAVEPLTVITGNTGVTISWQTGAGDAAVSVYYIKRAATTGLDERNVSDRVSLQSRSELNLLTANVTGNSFFWPAADLPSGNYYIYVETGNDYYIHGDFANGYIHVLGHTSGSGGTGEKIWSFPNPFSPANGQEAHIAYQVERDGWTKAYVYDIRGRQVWQGENYAYAGRDNIVNWDGRDGRGRLASNGLYILILTNDKNKIIAKGRLALHD
jgi:hypothetical protein